jgi:hypothetical protein
MRAATRQTAPPIKMAREGPNCSPIQAACAEPNGAKPITMNE